MERSSRTTSGWRRSASATASRPLSASLTTSLPSSSRTIRTSSRICGESSQRRTRITPAPPGRRLLSPPGRRAVSSSSPASRSFTTLRAATSAFVSASRTSSVRSRSSAIRAALTLWTTSSLISSARRWLAASPRLSSVMSAKTATAPRSRPSSSTSGAELPRSQPSVPSKRRMWNSSGPTTSRDFRQRAIAQSCPSKGRPSGWKARYWLHSLTFSAVDAARPDPLRGLVLEDEATLRVAHDHPVRALLEHDVEQAPVAGAGKPEPLVLAPEGLELGINRVHRAAPSPPRRARRRASRDPCRPRGPSSGVRLRRRPRGRPPAGRPLRRPARVPRASGRG